MFCIDTNVGATVYGHCLLLMFIVCSRYLVGIYNFDHNRLLEPRSVAINSIAHKLGREKVSGFNHPWIGVRGNKYASDGSRITISPPWLSSYRKIDKCLLYCNNATYKGQWCDHSCSDTYESICEPAT